MLVSRRHTRSKNPWMHNVNVLVSGKDRCTLLIHPEDASAYGVADGLPARVTSESGTIEVPVEVSDEMMGSSAFHTDGATTSPAPACRSPETHQG